MTLIVVCVLAAGMSFTPPAGWTVEKIEHQGEVMWMEYTTKPHTRITLKQAIKEGASVTIPDGCQGEAIVKEERKSSNSYTIVPN